MNRECPSSAFNFSLSESKSSRRCSQRLSILDIQNLTLAVYLPYEPRKHFACPDFDKSRHAFVEQPLD
jgi:hypothetical protein